MRVFFEKICPCLKAQVAANQRGIQLVTELIDAYGLDVVQAYMSHIQVVPSLITKVANSQPAFHLGVGIDSS